jgi:aryl-alcohol dehydrogenase-like predicted oxidoreductase
MTGAARPAHASGQFLLGGSLAVHRMGFGAMQLTGPGVWGPPSDPDRAVGVLRRAVELGVDLIDTADSYGPSVNEELIRRALHPYPDGLVIATKAGLTRPGPGEWVPNGRPAHLRTQCEGSLRRLGLERIALFQLHRIDPGVPLADQVGELSRLQAEGKIGHIGLSQVSVAELDEARLHASIVSVQNLYNLGDRSSDPVLAHAEASGLAFIPWFPLATGSLARPGGALAAVAARHGATGAQVALAWLLQRSSAMLPIPGTSSIDHLVENVGSAAIELTDADVAALDAQRAGTSPWRRVARSVARRRPGR